MRKNNLDIVSGILLTISTAGIAGIFLYVGIIAQHIGMTSERLQEYIDTHMQPSLFITLVGFMIVGFLGILIMPRTVRRY